MTVLKKVLIGLFAVLGIGITGFRAPDFAFEDLEGRVWRLSELKGKPVLLNFWATWCPPCRKEIPDLQAFHEQYGDRIVLLGINWGEDPEDVRAFLERYGATYTNLLDRDGLFFVKYQLTGLPTSYWIDEEGIIRGMWLGAMSLEDMVEGFRKTTRPEPRGCPLSSRPSARRTGSRLDNPAGMG